MDQTSPPTLLHPWSLPSPFYLCGTPYRWQYQLNTYQTKHITSTQFYRPSAATFAPLTMDSNHPHTHMLILCNWTTVSHIALYQVSISGLCDWPSGNLSVRWSVGLSVRKLYWGKTVEWIQMPLGMVSGVGRGMGVLDEGGDCRRGRGSFGGEFGAFHCNQ